MNNKNKYCESLINYKRMKTRVVNIGNIPLGGDNPIRIQSMTTTNTLDTNATVEQSIRMIEAGCDYIRITAPSKKEAQNLFFIKDKLYKLGYTNPIIADIHFTPHAAMEASRIVEKVRINPGNFADRKKFEKIKYTEASYNDELNRIHDRFVPLVKRCKEEGCAMRIGSNHGSLSDRILSHYGDTPIGMVESAMEFIRICEQYNYYDIVVSMKASNTRVMVQAYRLLVNQMLLEGMNYPLHLGVTEAGDGLDGRIKSSVGIGTLLEDGLGDTIRVSLTEEPEKEVPVALSLVNRYKDRTEHEVIDEVSSYSMTPFEYNKRTTKEISNIGSNNIPRVIADLSYKKFISFEDINSLGYSYFKAQDKWGISDFACDYLYIGNNRIEFDLPASLGQIQNVKVWQESKSKNKNIFPLFSTQEYLDLDKHPKLNFINISLNELSDNIINKIKNDKTAVLIVSTQNEHGMAEQRCLISRLSIMKINIPVIISRIYNSDISLDDFHIYSATDIGALLLDGFGDGVMINKIDTICIKEINKTIFAILQASRTRISKTEYISCPSCGRTLFDLQETTSIIRERTSHLKGVKIGIMGCIVNGPGEMADADYGYVGTGVGKISLYRGQEVVKSNIPAENAVDSLIDLIKSDGVWIEDDIINTVNQ